MCHSEGETPREVVSPASYRKGTGMKSMKIRDIVRNLKERGFTKTGSGVGGTYKHPSGPNIHLPSVKEGSDASSSVHSKYLKVMKSTEETPAASPAAPAKKEKLELHHFVASSSVRTYWAERGTFGSLSVTAAAAARRRAWAIDALRSNPRYTLRKVGETVRELDGSTGVNPTTVILLRHAVLCVIDPDNKGELTQKTLDRAGHLMLTKLERNLLSEGKDLEPLLATSKLDGYGRVLALQEEEPEVSKSDELASILRGDDHEIFDKLKELGVPVLDKPEPPVEEDVSAFGPSPKEFAALALKEMEKVMPELKEPVKKEEPEQTEFREALQLLFDTVWRTMPDCETVRINFDTKVVKVSMKVPEIPNFDDITVEYE